MARVQLKNVEKTFNKNKVLKGINVEVPDGSFMVMVGPSGCGKSTALRCIAGLEEVTGGSIFIGDEDVTSKEPKDRNIAMVFQNYALYPHMNVFDNITYGLKVRGIPADERKRRAEDAALLDPAARGDDPAPADHCAERDDEDVPRAENLVELGLLLFHDGTPSLSLEYFMRDLLDERRRAVRPEQAAVDEHIAVDCARH